MWLRSIEGKQVKMVVPYDAIHPEAGYGKVFGITRYQCKDLDHLSDGDAKLAGK